MSSTFNLLLPFRLLPQVSTLHTGLFRKECRVPLKKLRVGQLHEEDENYDEEPRPIQINPRAAQQHHQHQHQQVRDTALVGGGGSRVRFPTKNRFEINRTLNKV